MSAYVVAPEAEEDLVVIWHHYAEDAGDPDLADRMVGEIVSWFYKLAKMPGMGHVRSELCNEPLRFWAVRRYLIIYRSEKHPIEIVRVLHGYRDVKAIMDSDSGATGECGD